MKTCMTTDTLSVVTLKDLKAGEAFRFVNTIAPRLCTGDCYNISFSGAGGHNSPEMRVVRIEPYAVEDGTVLFRDVTS